MTTEVTFDEWQKTVGRLERRCRQERVRHVHLSPIDDHGAIMAGGLKSSTGEIFVADDVRVVGTIALDQVMTDAFDLYGVRIDPAWKLVPDDVAELTARHQWIIRRRKIPRSHVVYLGRFVAHPPYDRFLPLPAESLAEVPEKDRAQFARGYWPPMAPAYFYPID